MMHHSLRRGTTCVASFDKFNAMYGAAAWRGSASALGCVRCAVDGVGPVRQAFASASAFNQNIGSWNTASVTTMASVRVLVPSPACGAQPTSFSQQRSRARVVPGADVGMAQLGCGRVAVGSGSGLAQL